MARSWGLLTGVTLATLCVGVASSSAWADALAFNNNDGSWVQLTSVDAAVTNVADQYGYPPPPICACTTAINYQYYDQYVQEQIRETQLDITDVLNFLKTKANVTVLYNAQNQIQYVIVTPFGSTATTTTSSPLGVLLSRISSLETTNPTLFNTTLAILGQSSDTSMAKAAAQLQPVTNGATTQASLAAASQALGTIQAHNDSLRTADAVTGASAGDEMLGLTTWAQAFGAMNSQGSRDGVDGYDSRSWGFAAGADTAVLANLRLGLSLAQAFSHVDDTGSRDGSGLRINSTIASLYGNYGADHWYADSSLSYGWHATDSTRLIAVPGTAIQVANASFTAHQIEAKTEVGAPLSLGTSLGLATMTPLVSLDYAHFHQPGYTESGAAADLTMSSMDTDSIRTGLGGKAALPFHTENGWEIKPSVKAVWLHEYNGKAQTQTSSYASGGASFSTSGAKPGLDHADLGLGLDLDNRQGMRLSLKYDADLADRYWGNSGTLQVTVDF